jgi:hypothetical protein
MEKREQPRIAKAIIDYIITRLRICPGPKSQELVMEKILFYVGVSKTCMFTHNLVQFCIVNSPPSHIRVVNESINC